MTHTDGQMSGDDDGQQRADRVSDGLKQAFAALGPADIPADQKPRWHQRLIAITNSSKHDLTTAERRLESYWVEFSELTGRTRT